MHLGEAGVEEPMWVYLGFMRRFDLEQRFVEHPVSIRQITNLTMITPVPLRSRASHRMTESGILSSQMDQNLSSKLNSTATGAKRLRISGHICQSSFNFDSRREIRP
jgi:hypothetical protein